MLENLLLIYSLIQIEKKRQIAIKKQDMDRRQQEENRRKQQQEEKRRQKEEREHHKKLRYHKYIKKCLINGLFKYNIKGSFKPVYVHDFV